MAKDERDHSWKKRGGPPAGDLVTEIVETVSSETRKAAASGDPAYLDEIGLLLRSLVQRSIEDGSDLVLVGKGILVGLLRGTGEKGDAALTTLANASKIVLLQTVESEGDAGAAVKGLVLGAIAGAKDLELDRERAAAACAEAGLRVATDASLKAEASVRDALKENIGGVRVELPRS